MSLWKKALKKLERCVEKHVSLEATLAVARRESERRFLKALPNGDWSKVWHPGVLLADQICRAVDDFELIHPFVATKQKLRPAGYELSVGDFYSVNGEMRRLSDDQNKNEIIVKPFEVVIIQTLERLNVPEFMIARWNVTVGRAYEGFLWVGAAQVDPGFKGYLCCPIYNLSDKERRLKLGEPIAVIDFVVTTPPSDQSRKFSVDFTERKRILFDDYKPDDLKSALITHAQRRLDDFNKDVTELRGTVFNSIGIILAAIGALVTALALFVGKAEPETLTRLSPPLLVSFAALIVSFGALVTAIAKNRIWRYVWFSVALLVVTLSMYWAAWNHPLPPP
jgi:deoxycytidine triphosphate deaminase